LGVGVFKADGFGGEEIADFAGGVALPAAAGESGCDADGIADAKGIGRVAEISKEIQRNEVDHFSASLLQDDDAFAEALLTVGTSGFDVMDLTGENHFRHCGAFIKFTRAT
jgi:hypothetical protein